MFKKITRTMALFMALFAMGFDMSYAIIASSTSQAWSWPSLGDIVCWTGKGGRISGRSNTPEVCIADINSAGTVSIGNAAALFPGTDNTNPLGVQTLRWSDLQTITGTFGGNVQHTTSVGVVPSTTVSLGEYYQAFLASGSNSVASTVGAVLCSTTPVLNQGLSVVVCPPLSGLTTTVGIAQNAVSTGSIVNVFMQGFVLASTSFTVTTGDLLVSTVAAAGILATNNSAGAGTIVGTAMNACAANTGCQTIIRLR
jgi:hypothetical protein